MNFQNIKPVSSYKEYLETAFSKAKKLEKGERKVGGEQGQKRMLLMEQEKAKVIKDYLSKSLTLITTSFPSFNSLSEFYSKLIDTYLDADKLKQALGSVQRTQIAIDKLTSEYSSKLRRSTDKKEFLSAKKEYFGRISSMIKKLDENLRYLEQARKKLKDLPDIKDCFTVCIAGFPNVGKSTVLSKITSSTPEIKAYAFTTKNLNTGYFTHKYRPVQIIDTPGTLARFEKMNEIEKQSYLAIKYEADLVLFVYDLTEQYPIEDQDKLNELIISFGKPIIYYISKTDITSETIVQKFISNRKKIKFITNTADLKEEIIRKLMKA